MASNATPKQLKYIEDILWRNELYNNEFERLWAILEAARIDEAHPGDGSPMPKTQASATITWLLRQGYR